MCALVARETRDIFQGGALYYGDKGNKRGARLTFTLS